VTRSVIKISRESSERLAFGKNRSMGFQDGTYLFGLRDLENPGSQLGWQKIPVSGELIRWQVCGRAMSK
jgi:hypothetical protein